MTILTNEEKVAIINQHKRTVEYTKYGVELSILEENSVESPNQETLDSLNASISDLNSKLAVLDAEIASLS
jgi:hypothetical protein